MQLDFYKYQGTGNDFIIIDNRTTIFPKKVDLINSLCDRKMGIGADGLILLENSDFHDFKMVYYNADGNESSMCGNGGRCIVAFAKKLQLIENRCSFEAIDGLHHASIKEDVVSLEMIDVSEVDIFEDHIFLDTGSPHHVTFVSDLDNFDVYNTGKEIRYGAPYFEEGSNVNFVEPIDSDTYKVRTYERGVEDETLSCGTGVTAVAIAIHKTKRSNNGIITLETKGGALQVQFNVSDDTYKNIRLIGAATFVFKGVIEL